MPDNMRYILCEKVKNKFNAGSKARIDAETIAIKNGYKKIQLFSSGRHKIIIVVEIMMGCLKAISLCKKDDSLLIQYPYYPEIVNRLFFRFLGFGKKIKRYKITLLIHDVISLRYAVESKEAFNQKLNTEINNMAVFDYVICHNSSMVKLLSGVQEKSQYINLQLFDYLYDGVSYPRKMDRQIKVIIAGNLSKTKASYLYKLPETNYVQFCLYGNGFEEKKQKNVDFKGTYPPEELIRHLDGQYGLVWDGSSIESCEGSSGLYLKYNNPHKMSLYIAAGLPIIIWEQAALAGFVVSNGIGVAIKSITELDEVLSKVTEEQYDHMIHNVSNLRESVINGDHLTVALEKIC